MIKWDASRSVARPGTRAAPAAAVRVGPLMAIPALLQEFGCDAQRLCDGAGLGLAQFEDPDTRIPYLAGSKLLARCVKATACEHFGLLVGQRANASSLGIVGFLLRSAPDVQTALQDLIRYLDLHDDGGVPFLETAGRTSLFGYAILEPEVVAADQIYDLSVAVICNIMRDLCGSAWRPTEVWLERRRPRDAQRYRDFFRAPLRFDAVRSAVVFPSRWLNHRLAGDDPLLHRYLEREAAALSHRHSPDFMGEIRHLLRRLFATRAASSREIARQLGIHARTLNRRLRAEGTTFRRERERVRYAAAQQLLADSALSVARIAAALDYADASAFSRAFKRWSGSSPARWRARRAVRAG
jgi:AraC-like DNA-binding protein